MVRVQHTGLPGAPLMVKPCPVRQTPRPVRQMLLTLVTIFGRQLRALMST